MRRQDSGSTDLALFDLPLVVDPEVANEADREVADGSARARRANPEPERAPEQIDLPPAAELAEGPEGTATGPPVAAHLASRLRAGIVDGALSVGALALVVVGASRMDVALDTTTWPGFLVPVAVFSILYTIFSIAFWGRTPGMAQAGLRLTNARDASPTVGQAAGRWLGTVLTFALLGLPALLALRDGQSLADRMSGLGTERT